MNCKSGFYIARMCKAWHLDACMQFRSCCHYVELASVGAFLALQAFLGAGLYHNDKKLHALKSERLALAQSMTCI